MSDNLDIDRMAGYWAEFPVTYRAEQVAAIMDWVAAGESGVVIGGSGTGKSNLAGFLSSRPDAIAPHVSGANRYCLPRLDINSLPGLTPRFFFRGLIQGLQDAGTLEVEVQQAIRQLAREQINWDDLFEVLVTLQKAHQLVIRQSGKKVVWLLDRFDAACRELEAQVLNSLRSLRDQFKGQLCYIVFTRHALDRLRDPREIDEFYEIVAANTCRVGPMVERDSRWIARQMAGRLETRFDEPEVVRLIQATGGLPAFMKLACLALAEGKLNARQSIQNWAMQLLTRPEFQRNCQEIWADLLPEEQNILSALSAGAGERMLNAETVAYLEQAGLLVRSKPGAPVSVFSPIFERFIGQQRQSAGGKLELHPKTRVVIRDGLPLDIELTPQEDRLLSYFLEHPAEVCKKDTLMRTIWPDEQFFEGISDERLAQLIKRLREKIEPDPRQPIYIRTVRGQGYRFVQPAS